MANKFHFYIDIFFFFNTSRFSSSFSKKLNAVRLLFNLEIDLKKLISQANFYFLLRLHNKMQYGTIKRKEADDDDVERR